MKAFRYLHYGTSRGPKQAWFGILQSFEQLCKSGTILSGIISFINDYITTTEQNQDAVQEPGVGSSSQSCRRPQQVSVLIPARLREFRVRFSCNPQGRNLIQGLGKPFEILSGIIINLLSNPSESLSQWGKIRGEALSGLPQLRCKVLGKS